VKWNGLNSRYRSAIVSLDDPGRDSFVSLGFRKFTNFHEQPDFEPWAYGDSFHATRKIDGSLLIVSKYKGEIIIRTRGTFDASQLENGFEIEVLKAKYAKFFDSLHDLSTTFPSSVLFEWTTPNNVIVLSESDSPSLTLLGGIDNSSTLYWSREFTEFFAKKYELPVTETKHFSGIVDAIDKVEKWEDTEGIVITSPDFQTLKKIKAEHYLRLHRLRSQISSWKNLVSVYGELGLPGFEQFFEYIRTSLNFELAKCAEDDMRAIVEIRDHIFQHIEKVKKFIDQYKFFSKKETAIEIQHRWSGWKQAIAFIVANKGEDAVSLDMILKIIKNEKL
jgi:hypothetical protein